MAIKKVFMVVCIIGVLFPLLASAQVKISEIMYDPEGSDTKREWIEIFNTGTENIDLGTYFFFENNVHHKLTAQSSSILVPGAYAIIVDSIPEVLADFSGYSGLIFDSAFSLNNTGETISLANPQKVIINSATYDSNMGANNTGQSLQINGDNIIVAGPTFGFENKTVSEQIDEEDDTSTVAGSDDSSNSSSHSQQTELTAYTPQSFKIGAGRDRLVTVNTPIEFESHISKSDIRVRYLWNFGDMNTRTGKSPVHTYEYPGTYQVVLEGITKEHTAVSRTEVLVVEPQLQLIQATGTLVISNLDSREVNVGDFRIVLSGGFISIPRNTIIGSKGSITVLIEEGRSLKSFLYPNKKIYKDFKIQESGEKSTIYP